MLVLVGMTVNVTRLCYYVRLSSESTFIMMYKMALCVNKMVKLKPLVDAPVNSLWRDGGTDLRMQIVRITYVRSYK